MKSYIAVCENLQDLEDEINKKLSEGYFPYGNIVADFHDVDADTYIQHMLLPETDKEQQLLEQRMIHV